MQGLAGREVEKPGAVGVHAPDDVVLVAPGVAEQQDGAAVRREAPPDGALGARRQRERRCVGVRHVAQVNLRQAVALRAEDDALSVGREAGHERGEETVPVRVGVDDGRDERRQRGVALLLFVGERRRIGRVGERRCRGHARSHWRRRGDHRRGRGWRRCDRRWRRVAAGSKERDERQQHQRGRLRDGRERHDGSLYSDA